MNPSLPFTSSAPASATLSCPSAEFANQLAISRHSAPPSLANFSRSRSSRPPLGRCSSAPVGHERAKTGGGGGEGEFKEEPVLLLSDRIVIVLAVIVASGDAVGQTGDNSLASAKRAIVF